MVSVFNFLKDLNKTIEAIGDFIGVNYFVLNLKTWKLARRVEKMINLEWMMVFYIKFTQFSNEIKMTGFNREFLKLNSVLNDGRLY